MGHGFTSAMNELISVYFLIHVELAFDFFADFIGKVTRTSIATE